jgi:hypothetical protein
MPYPTFDAEERRERAEACVLRYRQGELGPISFVTEAVALGMTLDDARSLKLKLCAQPRGAITAVIVHRDAGTSRA